MKFIIFLFVVGFILIVFFRLYVVIVGDGEFLKICLYILYFISFLFGLLL